MRLVYIALAALLFVPILPLASASTASLQVSVTTNPGVPAPGTTGAFVFAIKNAGDASAYNINLNVGDIDAGIYLNGTHYAFLGGLSPAANTVSTPFNFQVGANTAPGFYHVAFSLTYSYESSPGVSSYGGMSFTGTVTVRAPSSLDLSSVTPNQVQPGVTTMLLANFTNRGSGDVGSVQGSWSNAVGSILPIGGSNVFFIASMAAGTTVSVPISAVASQSATPGLYNLQFTLAYLDATGNRTAQQFTTGILIGGQTDFDVAPADTAGGGTTNLNVANIGVNDAKGVLIEVLQGPRATQALSSTFVGSLNAGDFTVATITLRQADATASGSGGGFGGASRTGVPSGFTGGGPLGSQQFLRISYTDSTGVRRSVEKQVIVPPSTAPLGGRNGPPTGAWYTSPLVLGLGAAAAIATVIIIKRRRKAREL